MLHRNEFQEIIEFLEGKVAVRFLSSGEPHLNPHFVAVLDEFFNLPGPEFQVVLAGGEPDAYAFYLRLFLLFPVFALALLPVILELAEIHNSANRRLCHGGDFYKVKPSLSGNTERLRGFQNPEILALFVNNANGAGAYQLIDAIAFLNESDVSRNVSARQAKITFPNIVKYTRSGRKSQWPSYRKNFIHSSLTLLA